MDKSQDTLTSVFFMKDRVKTENITIMYCPTEQMLADFFTKPLQGSLFERFRRVLMGHAHVNTLSSLSLVPAEERVGGETETVEVQRTATGKNRQDNQVNGDVTARPTSGWTIVTRTQRKGLLPTTQGKVMPITRMKPERKNEDRAHSFA